MSNDIGSIAIGKLADFVITEQNPLENFKTLYGTGHYRLNEQNEPVRTGGVKYTVKDGIVYNAAELLQDVRNIVAEAKKAPATESTTN